MGGQGCTRRSLLCLMNRDEASGEDTDLRFTSGWGDAHHFHCPLQSAGRHRGSGRKEGFDAPVGSDPVGLDVRSHSQPLGTLVCN